MNSDRTMIRLATIAALCAALALAACGRKGPLDPPPAATVDPQAAADPNAPPPAPPGRPPNRKVPLDPLLN